MKVAKQGRIRLISDQELVVGALQGRIGAYDELVRRYRGAVIMVAEQTMGSREGAEDVAQETFLLAYKSLGQLQDPAKFAGWLYAIARRRARRIGRRDGRCQSTEQVVIDRLIVETSDEISPSPLEELIRAESREAIRALLVALPVERRNVLQLYYYEQWPVARIADFLSLSQTTVKWRLHSGRNWLCRHLMRRMEESSDG
jgi:RNA polymerase sigma-70 factor (ECF subfamily)